MEAVDMIFNLNELVQDAVIVCPYCHKGKTYSYGATGKESSTCSVCKRIVLWDFDRMTAYKAKARRFAS